MRKVLVLTLLLTVMACSEDKKPDQVIIPEAQLQALEAAKKLELGLLEMQQQKEKQLKDQGL